MYKYNLHDISIKEVDRQFIANYEIYMLSQCNMAKNGTVGRIKQLKHIITIALNKEYITRNPFKDHKLQWEKVDRGYLTQTELETLIDFKFEERRLEKARDIFIFCAFTGLAYTDAKHLTNSQIKISIEGSLWIKGKRIKTDTDYNIPLLNIPKMIIEKYKGKAKNDLVLPIFEHSYYNRLLKIIAQKCEINKNISAHLARHTFATLTLTKGVSIESVSKMLGHTDIKTTQIYAKVTNTKISNEMGAFAGNIKKMDYIMQLTAGKKEATLDDVVKSLKISTGNESDVIWENLSSKVWNCLSNIDKQIFTAKVNKIINKPKAIQDFYVSLMDYFISSVANINTDSFAEESESEFPCEEMKMII